MEVSRRQFIQLGGVAAATVAVPSWLTREVIPRPPDLWAARVAGDMPEPDVAALLLNRAAFAPRPGDIQRVRADPDAWIEEQLDYENIDDSQVEERLLQELPALAMTPRQLLGFERKDNVAPNELRLATIYRMIYSPRLLYEVMVEFWTDHFSMHHRTGYTDYLKTVDDREVIRKHALGKFEDLITASAMSPAMLNYLNNDVNTKRLPNENYAREIMELHTLGVAVDGIPYTEDDIKEVSKCLTGWSWDRRRESPTLGEFEYRNNDHWQDEKVVLGQHISEGMGVEDGRLVIEILLNHPATSRFLATKMVRRFVTDDPLGQTPGLVDRVADAFRRTGGDIKEMVSEILRSAEFAHSFATYGGRLSRPMDLMARSLRVLDAQPQDFDLNIRGSTYRNTMGALAAMGHFPFWWLTPDGYPDVKEAWGGTTGMLTRWNLGLAMAGVGGKFGGQLLRGFLPAQQTPADRTTAGAAVDFWIERLLQRLMLPEDRQIVVEYLTDGGSESTPLPSVQGRLPETIALILDSPYFQWR